MRLVNDLVIFWNAMGSLPWTIRVWAIFYPLPQVLGGFIFIAETPGLIILIGRAASFVIGSQVHRKHPFSKLIGPIGHAHWLFILPYLFYVLFSHNLDSGFYWFIIYVCVLSLISGVLDVRDVYRYYKHGESDYKRD